MGLLRKGRQCVTTVSLYILLMIILVEMYQTAADTQTKSRDTKQSNRHKRQAGDIILMGYKAQKALKGTTRPSEFFNRIGKKWAAPSSSLHNPDIYIRPDGFGDGVYVDDDYVKAWWLTKHEDGFINVHVDLDPSDDGGITATVLLSSKKRTITQGKEQSACIFRNFRRSPVT